jgi:hypothetical protein
VEKDAAIVMCSTIAELPEPELDLATGPQRDHCSGCGVEVWVSQQTLERAAQDRLDAPVLIVCNPCGEDMLGGLAQAGEDWEWKLTPDQAHLAPFLPVPRTKQRRRR